MKYCLLPATGAWHFLTANSLFVVLQNTGWHLCCLGNPKVCEGQTNLCSTGLHVTLTLPFLQKLSITWVVISDREGSLSAWLYTWYCSAVFDLLSACRRRRAARWIQILSLELELFRLVSQCPHPNLHCLLPAISAGSQERGATPWLSATVEW